MPTSLPLDEVPATLPSDHWSALALLVIAHAELGILPKSSWNRWKLRAIVSPSRSSWVFCFPNLCCVLSGLHLPRSDFITAYSGFHRFVIFGLFRRRAWKPIRYGPQNLNSTGTFARWGSF